MPALHRPESRPSGDRQSRDRESGNRRRSALRAVVLGSLAALTATFAAPRGTLACEAMVGSEYTDPPEVMDVGLDSEQWHQVFRTRDAGGARKEWVPAGETLTHWKQLVAWRIRFGENPYTLKRVKDSFLQTVTYICPKVKSNTVEKSETEILFEWWHEGDCYGRDEQYHIARVINAATGVHHLSYSFKGAPLTGAERDQWLARIRETPIRIDLPEGKLSPLEQGRLDVWKGKYEEGVKLLEPLAKKGNADAQLELGKLYYEGWGVGVDYAKSLEWFRKAAAQKHAAAHYSVGRIYENGWGVDKDEQEARKWFQSAAELGDAEAQGRIGFLLVNDPEPDYAKAAEWFRKSAAEGHHHALFWLGRMNEEGWGMEKNLESARKLYHDLAILGEPDAQYRIGLLYREGRGVEASRDEAAKWLERAAVQGSAEARELYFTEYAAPGVGRPDLN